MAELCIARLSQEKGWHSMVDVCWWGFGVLHVEIQDAIQTRAAAHQKTPRNQYSEMHLWNMCSSRGMNMIESYWINITWCNLHSQVCWEAFDRTVQYIQGPKVIAERTKVLHRDLKPSNIFLTGRSSGIANLINEEDLQAEAVNTIVQSRSTTLVCNIHVWSVYAITKYC